jgi:hypothetical protein
LHAFLAKLPAAEIRPLLESVVQYLEPLLESQVGGVRRRVLSLFAECRYKDETEFEQFLPRFTASQQAFIEKRCAARLAEEGSPDD